MTHNLGVAAYMSDWIVVMKNGEIADSGNRNYILPVIKSLTPEADFAALKELTESYSYEDCLARRTA